jgi:hypothetical protein
MQRDFSKPRLKKTLLSCGLFITHPKKEKRPAIRIRDSRLKEATGWKKRQSPSRILFSAVERKKSFT